MKRHILYYLLTFGLVITGTNNSFSQPWSYDFGTGTGSYNTASGSNTSFFSSTPSGGGTYRVRAGSSGNQGSGFVLANTGTSLGSGTEVQINASVTTSTNKFCIYDWTSPSTVAYVKAKFRTTSSGNGNINFSLGINTLGSDNNGYTSQYNNSLVSFVIPYSSGSIGTVSRRISGSNTTISSHGFTKDGDQTIEIYANNSASSNNYTRNGTSYSLATKTWDLWVDGTRVVNNGATAGSLASGTNLSGFGFFAESSTSNAAFVYIDDIEYSNALPTVTNPVLSTPTATSITHNSATLGANITSDGGASISARGTVYKTSSPVTSSDNATTEGGTSTGTYSHSRTGLAEQTLYYYAGYATNSNGTGLSSEGNFRTLSSPPTGQATGLSGTPASSTQIDLSISGAATFPGSGATKAGYLVIYSTGTPSLSSTNGQAPVAGVGTIFSTSTTDLPTTPATTINVTGLTSNTTYNFLVIPYTWDGTNAATYNYLTASAPTASATTNAGVPALSTPTASSIGATSATLGATVTSDGGSALTARGTVFKTSSPVTSSDNASAEGGTAVSSFSHSRTGFTEQTLYYYAGYATNSSGTSLSTEGSFRTLSAAPTVQAASVSTSNATSTTLDVTIGTAATFPGTGATQAGYVVIYSTGTPTLSSTNGQAPAAGVGTIFSTAATNLPSTPSTTITITGLSSLTTYNILVVPYTWDGTNATTYNYLTTSAPTASGSTLNPTAGLQLSAANTAYTIDFDNTVSGVNVGQFAAASTFAASSPSTGQLNSNAWGYSASSSTAAASFGGNITSGNGQSNGAVSTLGVYSFNTGSSNYSFGIQPTGSGWNGGGNITLRLQNQTGSTVTSLSIYYKVWVRNDQGRSSSFNFSHSGDNSSYTNATGINLSTTEVADGSPTWKSYYRIITLTGLNVSNSAYYYIRWYGADVSGSGSRDEFAIDDISVIANPTSTFPSITGTPEEIILDGNATLDAAINTASINLVSGQLTTTASNLLTVTGTATSAVSRTSGYVNGPMALTLPASLSSGSTYLFPIGKSAYTPIELVNPTTNSGGTVVIKAEVFDASTGGSAGTRMATISSTRYWDMSISSGGSNFTNTTVKATESSIGTYTALANNSTTLAGSYAAVSTASPSGNSITSTSLTSFGYFLFGELAAPSLTEVYVPQFMQGKSGTNDNRLPHAFRVTLSNLYPSTTYRYYNSAVISGDAGTSNGAGNPIFVDAGTSTFTRSTSPDLSSSYGSFTTDASGNYSGWFVLEPTGDTRFDIANSVYMRIMLNDGAGGTTVATRLTTTNTAKIIDLSTGTGANDGSAIYGGSSANEKNFAVLFDNLNATGRPISATVIESDGIANTTANGYASFYETNVNGSARKWGTIVPNVNANGIKRIEYRSITDGSMQYWVSDNDGNWNGTENTVNRASGTTAIIIPSGVTDSVTFGAGSTTTMQENMTINGKLDLGSGAKLALNGFTLTVNDGFKTSSSGFITGSATSGIIVGGTGSAGSLLMDQTTPGTTNKLLRLVVTKSNGTLTIGNTLNIVDSVTVTQSGATIASGGNLTLISDASKTARVGRLTGSITGNVVVQRHIPAVTRRYRTISPNTANFTFSQLIDDIYVTGTGGATNGFDATTQNSPSIYTYQESTGGSGRGWKAVTNITNTLDPGQGALVFIRGDRTLASPDWYSGPFPSQNVVSMDFVETINSGNISPTLTYTNTSSPTDDGWNLIGNPYPSQINLDATTRANLSAFFYTFNTGTGSYETFFYDDIYVASGQAFFVQATAASPSITFTENCKVPDNPTGYFKSGASRFTVRMTKDSLNSDMAQLQFKTGASTGYNANEDAQKFPNSTINLGFLVGTKQVQLNSIPPLTNIADTFTLFANAAAGTYTLNFSNMGMIPINKAILLRDLFTAQISDLRNNPNYTFTITSNSNSSGNRFQLIFIDQSALPVKLLYLRANKMASTSEVQIDWATVTEKNNAHFVVERSMNNETFEEIGIVKGNYNSNQIQHYTYTDKQTPELETKGVSTVYYRLQQVDFSGEVSVSQIVSVQLGDMNKTGIISTPFVVYPNPAHHYIQLKTESNFMINEVAIFDITGKKLRVIDDPKKDWKIDVSDLSTGVYFIKINNKYTEKLIIE